MKARISVLLLYLASVRWEIRQGDVVASLRRRGHHLVISGVTLTEDGEYQCQVGPTDRTPPIWAAANVTVLLAPTSIRIVGWSDASVVEVKAGAKLTLECLVTDARPPASVSWYMNGVRVSPEQITQELEPSQLVRRWSVRSQVVIEAKAEDNGKQLACKAAHPALRRTPTPTLQTSVTLSVLRKASVSLSHVVQDPAGVPVISGYRTGEILRAGERRTLSCRSRGGNPRPSLTWFRNGRVMDDASARDAAGTINTLELAVTAKEDGAVYECRVRNDVLEKPLAANVTLTVYYPSSYVSLAGPAHVKVGEPISLTCETAESNPPSSLTWVVQGEVVQGVKERVSRVSSGGWVTSSELTKYVVRSRRISEVVVECRALNPAIDRVVKKTSIIDITQPPGPPVLEGDIHSEVVAGSTISLACTSKGGRPRPVIRIYKKDKLLPTELMRGVGVTRARSEVVVTPADNGVRVTCEVSSPATTAPLATSTTLAVFFAPWEVQGSVSPSTVEEGRVVTLSCKSSSSLPESSITWRSNNVTLEGAGLKYSRGAFGGTQTRSELRMRTSAADNGKDIVCSADNGLGSPVHTTLFLNVLHSPVWVVRPKPIVDVLEGTDVVITAIATANPGPLRYWWWRGKETLRGGDGKLRLGRVSRKVSGNYTVTAYSQRGAINATFYLDVQYGPERVQADEHVRIDRGSPLAVTCSAKGNPKPNLTWSRRPQTPNSTERVVGAGVGVVTLRAASATKEYTGVYLCRASNVVSSAPPIRTRVVVSREGSDRSKRLWQLPSSVGGRGWNRASRVPHAGGTST
ncbi:nephrin-like [Penaeus indicus]|uniref:nephrin-like n=1 Tax=Penaeus indicus TaxID=29960 RepID=UPI00300CF90B